MEKAELDPILDKWLEKANENIGEVRTHKTVGPYPVNVLDYYGQQMNEWVTTDSIKHFAAGMGDRNPLWWNEDYAKKTKWGGIIAPPTFVDFIAAPYTTRKVRSPIDEHGFVGLPSGPSRRMFQVIRPGDRLKVVDKWLGMREIRTKDERFRFFISTEERTYTNQKDEVVAIINANWATLATYEDPKTMDTLFAGGGRQRRRSTDEERDAIIRGYDEETRRGSDSLLWEDVVVGEEVNLHSAGPLTAWDTAAFLEAIPGRAIAFDAEWERIKTDFHFSWLDPEMNVWTTGGEGHFRDGGGHSKLVTGGYAFGFGGQHEGLICRAICNWMGDDGFVKRMDSQFRAPVIWGDVLCVKGKVTNKYVEGDEHLVDLEFRCENRDGLLITSSRTTVSLPSRA